VSICLFEDEFTPLPNPNSPIEELSEWRNAEYEMNKEQAVVQ